MVVTTQRLIKDWYLTIELATGSLCINSFGILSSDAVPTLPTSLSISVFSSTILNVTWDAPSMLNAPTVTYILQYRIVDNSSAIVVTGIVDAMFSIVDLKPFSNYSVVVQACSEVGCSPFTEEVTAVTIEGGMYVHALCVMYLL